MSKVTVDASRLPDFRKRIQHEVILGDGAMATLLHQHGVPARTCYEELCLSHPEMVRDVHSAYVTAGATLLQTNTFSASRPALARYQLDEQLEPINRAAVRIAREAAGDTAYVFGTIGPVIGLLKRDEWTEERLAREAKTEIELQARALLSESVDGILLETFSTLGELLCAVQTIRGLTDKPVIANLSPLEIGYTEDGVSIDTAFRKLAENGADVVGLNCRLGPAGIARSYETVDVESGGAEYAAVPNAGLLKRDDGDFSYTGNATYFANTMLELVGRGVHLIGGCCGTTPDYIRAVHQAIESHPTLQQGLADVRVGKTAQVSRRSSVAIPGHGHSIHAVDRDIATSKKSDGMIQPAHLVDLVRTRTTVIVELDPPKTLDCARFFTGAKALRDAGADFITMADNSLAMVRVSNMALASVLKAEGIEPLVHVACRDRNLIGQQSHLMGLEVLGIRHVLLVTGDPSRFGDLPGATAVYDVSSMELTRMVRKLNDGVSFSGKVMKESSRFIVGTSFNPNVRNFDKAIERLFRKVEAGADYVMTQPIYNPALFERLARSTESLGVPIFVGIMPMTSDRNAQFLHNEVPGIEIPDSTLARMASAPTDGGAQTGVAIARELIDEALNHFQGIYLMTPFLRYDLTVELTQYVRSQSAVEVPGEIRWS